MAERLVSVKFKIGVTGKEKVKDIEKIIRAISEQTFRLEKTFRKTTGASTAALIKQGKETQKLGITSNKSFSQAGNSASSLGRKVRTLEKTTTVSSKKMGYAITFIAWHFRYLGSIFDRVSRQMLRVVKDVIKISAELEESFLSIRTAAAMYGRDAERATKFSRELALTGLIPLVEAASSVKNLMITGIGLPELEKFTYRYLDVAFLFTSGADEMSVSLETMTKSILRGTLVLSTDVTARNLWIKTETRLQKTMGLSMKQLTSSRRTLELLTTIEEEYANTLGFHRIEMETTRAAMTRMNAAITMIKDSFGMALLPILHLVSKALVRLSGYIIGLIKAIGPTIPVIVSLTLVITYFIAKMSFLIGVILSFIKISAFFGIVLWKIYLPLIAIGVVLGVGTYLLLKYTGALDKAKQSASNMSAQLNKIEESMKGIIEIEEDGIGISEDRRIAHERTIEDIEEDLERERSKGLWANQMIIKDLEKRLRRENEDWSRYMDDRKEQTGEESGMFGQLMSDLDELGKEVDEETKKMVGFFSRLKDPEMWAGIRDSILDFVNGIKKVVSDPVFWTEFGKELANNMGKIIIGIGDVVKAAFEGLFGSVMKGVAVVAALTFVTVFGVSLLKYFAAGGIGFVAVTSAGAAITAALLAAIPATIAITVVLLSTAALYNVIKLRETIDGLWNSVDNLMDVNNRLIGVYIDRFREGKISAEEFKRKTDDLNQSALETIKRAEEARWSWGKFFSGEYLMTGLGQLFPNRQFGGIVPGLRNQAVPIMAHGGERIIPAGEVGGGENITININNPSVRNDRDISEIARQVSEALGRRNRFGRLGAF